MRAQEFLQCVLGSLRPLDSIGVLGSVPPRAGRWNGHRPVPPSGVGFDPLSIVDQALAGKPGRQRHPRSVAGRVAIDKTGGTAAEAPSRLLPPEASSRPR